MKKNAILTRDEKRAIPFILPSVIISALLIVYPLYYIFRMSFNSSPLDGFSFAWFDNYAALFRNPQFGRVMMNTLVWTVSTVVFTFLIGSALALLIHREQVRFKGLWRSLIFIAWIIPGVVKATSWKWLFTNDGGMVNHILMSLGVIDTPIPWLISNQYAMLALIVVQVWACAPYVMLMMTAGLQQLPQDVYESADLDGASGIRKTIHITLPMLKDVSFICILLVLIWAINEFSLIWILTNGGPGGSTTTLSLMVYNQFKVLNMNAASASAVMQLLISMVFAVLYVASQAKED